MPHLPKTTLTILLTIAVAVALVATMFGGFVAFVPGTSPGDSQESGGGNGSEQEVTAPQTVAPPVVPTDPRAATVNGVTLTLVDIRKSADPKGIEVTVELANQTKGGLTFAFFPARDISLSDNLGGSYNFSWAEYAGEVEVAPGQKTRLMRAFFAGPDRDASPDHLLLTVSSVPQIGKATWEINWPASSTKPSQISALTPSSTPEGDKATSGVGTMITQNKVSLTLKGADFNSELGGLIVAVAILNNSAADLSFPFAPETSMSVLDNRGSKFNLRWAEYSGIVTVSRGQQVQLVKAFFEGPISDPTTNSLTVSVSEIPEFGKASWQVSVKR